MQPEPPTGHWHENYERGRPGWPVEVVGVGPNERSPYLPLGQRSLSVKAWPFLVQYGLVFQWAEQSASITPIPLRANWATKGPARFEGETNTPRQRVAASCAG